MQTNFANLVMNSSARLAIPIGVYAGLQITGATVQQAVSSARAQVEAILALRERFHTPACLTAMDLSVEAEAFGSSIRFSDTEIPTVVGRLASNRQEIERLQIPAVGEKRMKVYLEAIAELKERRLPEPLMAGMIGPFSLAGRLFGVSEALELTLGDPAAMQALLEKTTEFLIQYALAFREAGADGVIMAEPAAGLLSPRAMIANSSRYIKQIVTQVQTPQFAVIYHNCGAKAVHINSVFETGAEIFHFGEPMDIVAALQASQGCRVIAGNLDPADVFLNSTPQQAFAKTRQLVEKTGDYKNFIVSSGCDLPPGIALDNLAAFFQAARQ